MSLALIVLRIITLFGTLALFVKSMRLSYHIDTARKKIQDTREIIEVPELLPAVRFNTISMSIGTVVCMINVTLMGKRGRNVSTYRIQLYFIY